MPSRKEDTAYSCNFILHNYWGVCLHFLLFKASRTVLNERGEGFYKVKKITRLLIFLKIWLRRLNADLRILMGSPFCVYEKKGNSLHGYSVSSIPQVLVR
ncbi:unnamed protein product [Hymenolepis diminuta]|uniref:Uncharacterized protein n=1 Tax=Hymenolepis diminuta TaxID=6216 RepID=A0A564Z846_HYMDI|nr:unnamed protein product [Hymenolepis diminuta]